jgi:uncharacterized membrane protein YczE
MLLVTLLTLTSVHCAERTTEVNKVNLFLYFKDVFGFFIDLFNSLISLTALFFFRSITTLTKKL